MPRRGGWPRGITDGFAERSLGGLLACLSGRLSWALALAQARLLLVLTAVVDVPALSSWGVACSSVARVVCIQDACYHRHVGGSSRGQRPSAQALIRHSAAAPAATRCRGGGRCLLRA
jgi:hypothetical protein